MTLEFSLLTAAAKAPRRAHDDDAGYDLHAAEAATLAPGTRASVGTGVALAIPPAHAGLVLPRSGLAARHGIALVNAPGLIDAGYRGEVRVLLLNTDVREPYEIGVGDRIAQLVVVVLAAVDLRENPSLAASARGPPALARPAAEMGEGDLHRYRVTARWRGSTGDGWAAYERSHEVRAEPAEQTLAVTTGESHGDPSKLNPEQLLVAAACSCQLLWFLHLAAKARVEVLEYDDHAEGLMRVDERPASVSEITLRPRIVVAEGASRQRVRRLAELAHDECYIANSLKSEVRVEPRVELAAR